MAQRRQLTPQQLAFLTAKAAEQNLSLEDFMDKQQKALEKAAAEENMSPEAFAEKVRQGMIAKEKARIEAMQAQQQGQGPPQPGQPGQQQKPGQSPNPQQGPPQQQMQRVAVSPGQPVDPKALAVAKFLRSQALKPRTCILNGERKDMFKGMLPTAQTPFISIRSDQVPNIAQSSELSAPSSPPPMPKPPQRRTPSFHL